MILSLADWINWQNYSPNQAIDKQATDKVTNFIANFGLEIEIQPKLHGALYYAPRTVVDKPRITLPEDYARSYKTALESPGNQPDSNFLHEVLHLCQEALYPEIMIGIGIFNETMITKWGAGLVGLKLGLDHYMRKSHESSNSKTSLLHKVSEAGGIATASALVAWIIYVDLVNPILSPDEALAYLYQSMVLPDSIPRLIIHERFTKLKNRLIEDTI